GRMVIEPQGTAHYPASGLVDGALRAALGPGWLVRSQGPIALDDESEPEPDIAVMRGDRRSYSHRHPSRPALVLEVAESSLAFDREHKEACTLARVWTITGSSISSIASWKSTGGPFRTRPRRLARATLRRRP